MKKKTYKWVVEFEVDPAWVADGFNLTDKHAKEWIEKDLARSHWWAKITISEDEYDKLKQDWNDMYNAHQTHFKRCLGCGRLSEPGIICPTVKEGKECKQGE